MKSSPPIAWVVAAENDWIPGGKVGGVGDVIRDLPPALVREGWQVRVITPSYGAFHRAEGAKALPPIRGEFSGEAFEASVWQLANADAGVEQVVIEHPCMQPGGPGEIYHTDTDGRPFAIDSGKFAFFCAAVAAWLEDQPAPPDVVHLHDWHTGLLPFLRHVSPEDSTLARTRMVFTIHNLAYQGVRPIEGDDASFASWFPQWVDQVGPACDPHDPDLVNFMATALRLSDAVATVSPTYAKEILQPSNPDRGFYGGEGLEDLLHKVKDAGRLSGVLNGCEYPGPDIPRPAWSELVQAILAEPSLRPLSDKKQKLLRQRADDRPETLLLSIGRLVDQKVALFLEPVEGQLTALEVLLERLGDRGMFLLLGSGDVELEQSIQTIGERHDNFVFLNGYAQGLSDQLYLGTDLFLMPSSFEPCGISQLLALRASQPCVVHGVGGLADTIEDGVTGFVSAGVSPQAQAREFVQAVERALAFKAGDVTAWERMREEAASRRFSWDLCAEVTIRELYES